MHYHVWDGYHAKFDDDDFYSSRGIACIMQGTHIQTLRQRDFGLVYLKLSGKRLWKQKENKVQNWFCARFVLTFIQTYDNLWGFFLVLKRQTKAANGASISYFYLPFFMRAFTKGNIFRIMFVLGLHIYIYIMCMFCIIFNLCEIWICVKPWGDPVRLTGP